ncbi:hypothetical protein Scep_015228 [Stephania cephalantha]|uniref:Uncharacterized protein n=1 Tax=Stephania cephalantha TaxID=152367 RepID=A0AAP0P070_9MAGN
MSASNECNEASDRFHLRMLEASDKSNGFVDLLQQLSTVGSISDSEFEDRFRDLSSRGDEHVICVGGGPGVEEDSGDGERVGGEEVPERVREGGAHRGRGGGREGERGGGWGRG